MFGRLSFLRTVPAASLIGLFATNSLSLAQEIPLASATSATRQVADFTLKDFRGKEVSLSDFDDSRIVVLAFLGTECPLAKLYAPRLEQIADEYADEGVTILGICPNRHDSLTEIAAYAIKHELSFPVLKDLGNEVADAVGAERTPEVILLDQLRHVRYRGRIDDQYVVGLQREKADREDLKLAIEEVLSGKEVSVSQTEPLGCIIGRVRGVKADAPVTWSNQISRLFNRSCVECHRDGEIAPFALTDYDEAAGWGEMIAEVVAEERMPPWFADPAHGTFANDRSLTEEEKSLIHQWVADGCPEGDPAELPEPPQFVDGWQLPQQPDEVLYMADEDFVVPAEGGVKGLAYQNFRVDPKFTEDKWVKAVEVQPGNRAVVHHIIVYVHPPAKNGKQPSQFFAAYVPGLRAQALPDGAARRIPAGSQLRFQMHYTPIGTVQHDRSFVGFVYTEPDEVTHIVTTTEVANHKFVLEPYKDDQQVTAASGSVDIDVTLMAMSPHMHLRGDAFRYEVEYPDGSREILLDVPRYDFNWQTKFRLAEPKVLPAGSRMICTALFDNSEENLANPDPSQEVRWGDQTWEEMMIGFFDVIYERQLVSAGGGKKKQAGRLPTRDKADQVAAELLKRYDADKDGRLSRQEAGELALVLKHFGKIDANNDRGLDRDELEAAAKRLLPKR